MSDPARIRSIVPRAVAVISVAAAAKLFYSKAGVNDLLWILAPTRFLAEIATGERFFFEPHAGFMIADRSFLIAGSCSGMNFLITAFVMLAFLEILRDPVGRLGSWRLLPAAAAAAYVATIGANAARIAVAIRLHRGERGIVSMSTEDIHRFEGILVYFGFLLLLFALADFAPWRGRRKTGPWKLVVPPGVYWMVTLGIPLLTGVRIESGFLRHSLFVTLVPVVLTLPFLVLSLLIKHAHRRRRRSPPEEQGEPIAFVR